MSRCTSVMDLPVFLSGVDIEMAAVPSALEGATARGVLWQAAPGRFLLEVPDVARYRVTGGRTITIDPMPQADEADVRRFLWMTPLAALLFQRGTLAFHAASAVPPGDRGTVLLAGSSGSGKSTLLARLIQRGWQMLGDELAAVDLDGQGKPVLFPTSPEIVLWKDAVERLKDIPGFKDTGSFGRETRRVLRKPTSVAATPRPLRVVYSLHVYHEGQVKRHALAGTERFEELGRLSYNSIIADALLDRTVFFRKAAGIAQSVPLHRLDRPRRLWSVEELAEEVEKELTGLP